MYSIRKKVSNLSNKKSSVAHFRGRPFYTADRAWYRLQQSKTLSQFFRWIFILSPPSHNPRCSPRRSRRRWPWCPCRPASPQASSSRPGARAVGICAGAGAEGAHGRRRRPRYPRRRRLPQSGKSKDIFCLHSFSMLYYAYVACTKTGLNPSGCFLVFLTL